MIAFQQIILLKKYEVKMHQRFCKPDKKYTPASPQKSSAKKRMSTSSFRSSKVIYFKSSKANNKVNFTLPLSGKKILHTMDNISKVFTFGERLHSSLKSLEPNIKL